MTYPLPQPQMLMDSPRPQKVTILSSDNPRLRQTSLPVTEFGPDLYQLVSNLAAAMYSLYGVGLAAPQIGVLQRVFVVDLFSAPLEIPHPKIQGRMIRVPRSGELLVAVNPELIDYGNPGQEGEEAEEGCLSFPGLKLKVWRPQRVRIKAQDHRGEWWEAEWGEMLARVVQHEYDHLCGVLFTDYQPPPVPRNTLRHRKGRR